MKVTNRSVARFIGGFVSIFFFFVRDNLNLLTSKGINKHQGSIKRYSLIFQEHLCVSATAGHQQEAKRTLRYEENFLLYFVNLIV
jgi:hypothetical protein